jgi:hypothetical protein
MNISKYLGTEAPKSFIRVLAIVEALSIIQHDDLGHTVVYIAIV